MTYEQSFSRAVEANAVTQARIRIYKAVWDGSYFATPYLIPLPHPWATLIGEVNRGTPR